MAFPKKAIKFKWYSEICISGYKIHKAFLPCDLGRKTRKSGIPFYGPPGSICQIIFV